MSRKAIYALVAIIGAVIAGAIVFTVRLLRNPANDSEADASDPAANFFYQLRAWLQLDNTEPEQPAGLQVINLIDRVQRKAPWPTRPVEGITDITIHHSAGNPMDTADQISGYHMNEKKWPGIAYHFLVYRDGGVYQVNPVAAYSYHNGFNNRVAIGICLPGNFEETVPPDAQVNAVVELVKALKLQYPGILYCNGHKEYKNTTLCPGRHFDMEGVRQGTGLGDRLQQPA